MPRKNTILTNKLFHKLWDGAKNSNLEDYIGKYLKRESEDYIDFERKYGIEGYLSKRMLTKIHELSNMTFSELMKKTGLKNSEVADRYCIAIRNVQQWANGKAKCPSYVVLMILRDEHMLDFDGMITTEWEVRFKKTYPAIYNKRNVSKTSHKKEKIYDLDNDKYEKYKSQMNVKTDIDEILRQTDYLKKIINK